MSERKRLEFNLVEFILAAVLPLLGALAFFVLDIFTDSIRDLNKRVLKIELALGIEKGVDVKLKKVEEDIDDIERKLDDD